MRFFSTRDSHRAHPVALREAVLRGLAPDGGLFLPEDLPPFPEAFLDSIRERPFAEVAEAAASHLLSDMFGPAEIRGLVDEAFTFPVPVVELAPDLRVVELFHGPTDSFKDFGARFLAALLSRLRDEGQRVRILVATSGDTGGAVAHAVHGIRGVEAIVLFPQGRISPVQLRQIAGAPGVEEGSVRALAVRGSFDDCQRMVKEALACQTGHDSVVLTSANSVNIGRLIPQIFFHVHAWAHPPRATPNPIVSVPSGNLGNLTAGVMAWRMGLPVGGFVAAMNENGPLARERMETPSRATLSSAMDVTAPSNLERLLALFPGGWEELRQVVASSIHSDKEVLAEMRRLHRAFGYFSDPHAAVGFLGSTAWGRAERGRTDAPAPRLVLATADPAKFPAAVIRATGHAPPGREGWDADAAIPDPGRVLEPTTDALLDVLRG